MQQQINLFRVLQPAKTSWFDSQKIWIAYGVFIIWLAGGFLYQLLQQHRSTHKLNTLITQLKTEQQALIVLMQKNPFLNPEDLTSSLQKLQQELVSKNKIVNVLNGNAPFSDVLMAIARAAVPGMWLTHINISNSGNDMILTGKVTYVGAVQNFLNQLRQQTVLAMHTLVVREITKTPSDAKQVNPYLDFTISTQAAVRS
jgi:Tfp pilus assembly protein PilN